MADGAFGVLLGKEDADAGCEGESALLGRCVSHMEHMGRAASKPSCRKVQHGQAQAACSPLVAWTPTACRLDDGWPVLGVVVKNRRMPRAKKESYRRYTYRPYL